MRAVLVDSAAAAGVCFRDDHPPPRPRRGEVLIRMLRAGICATDLELARGYMGYRGVLGHEFVGVVETRRSRLFGRRVVGEINCPCRRCDMCRAKLPTHCRRRSVLGILGRDGAFAERLALPEANLHALPDRVADEHAVFVEPLAAAVHVLDELPRSRRLRVAVVGAGRLGLLIAQVLKAAGLRPQVIGRSAARLALCRGWKIAAAAHAEIEPDASYDAVVESSGAPAGLVLAQALVKPRGLIVLKSTYATPEPIDLAPLVIHEIRVVGSRCGAFPPAIRLLRDGKIDAGSLITGRFPLSQAVAAFEAAARPEHIKVLLHADGG